MSRPAAKAYDAAWNRRDLAALAVLCVVSGALLVCRGIWRPARLGENIAVHTQRVRAASERIDPNTASVASLRRLPGIGSGKAEAIVAERQKRLFAGPDDLQRVHGIGPKTVEGIRPFLEIKTPDEE